MYEFNYGWWPGVVRGAQCHRNAVQTIPVQNNPHYNDLQIASSYGKDIFHI